MQRLPFVLKFKPGMKEEGIQALKGVWGDVKTALDRMGADNFSVWGIQDFLFCYGEYPDSIEATVSEKAAQAAWEGALSPYLDMFAAQGTLPLMYHDIGIVREDKSLIRHRVFSTKLKEGCAADVIVTDYVPITPMDASNCNGHILYFLLLHMQNNYVLHSNIFYAFLQQMQWHLLLFLPGARLQ